MNFKSLRSACTLIAITGMLLLAFSSCDWKRPKKEFITFQEMQDPTNDTLSDWSNVKAGLHS